MQENVEWTEERVLILRGWLFNWDLNKLKVNSDETCEMASAVIILTGTQCFVVVLLQSWDRWRVSRVSIFISHFGLIMTSSLSTHDFLQSQYSLWLSA